MNLHNFKTILKERKEKLTYLEGKKDSLNKRIENLSQEVTILEANIKKYEKTSLLLQKVSEKISGDSIGEIERVITEALQETCNLRFIIKPIDRKGSISYDFEIYDDDLKQTVNLLRGSGGGIKDLIATALRVITLELCYPGSGSPIVLDETGKFISVNFQESYGRFLSSLSEKLNRQIILISHQEGVIDAADKVFRFSKPAKTTEVEIVK